MKFRTGANTHSIMEQRKEPHDSLDFFPTQPWVTRAIAEVLNISRSDIVWEPAAGERHMSRVLAEYSIYVAESDVQSYNFDYILHDFLMPGPALYENVSWIITNPPYKLAEQFVLRAIDLRPSKGVAMLLRSQWRHNPGRYERLFSKHPPTHVYEISDRLTMLRGRCQKHTDTGQNGATEYSWFVWRTNRTNVGGKYTGSWIEPGTRKRLEKPEDYE